MDESGEGDYFGPLVAAGGCVPPGGRKALAEIGVRTARRLGHRLRTLAATVRAAHPWVVVAIGPERYNELYQSMRNLNRLLAGAQARVIAKGAGRFRITRQLAPG